MAFVEIRDLHRTYRTLDKGVVTAEQAVFAGLDLDIEEGELVAVVGPNGCGKSTLLNMVGGLDTVEKTVLGEGGVPRIEGRGTIAVDRFPISSAQGDVKADFVSRNIGFVFQFHHLLSELSAVDNVALPRMIRGDSQARARRAAAEMLERVHLPDHGDKRPAVLSGGEKQRVSIARALINRPRLLLADEPTGSLHPHLKGEIFDLLLGLNLEDGITILLVTHDTALLRDETGSLRADRLISLVEARRNILVA